MNAKRIAKQIVAGAMKRWLEEVSVDMGLGGEINDDVMAEGRRRLDRTGGGTQPAEPSPNQTCRTLAETGTPCDAHAGGHGAPGSECDRFWHRSES